MSTSLSPTGGRRSAARSGGSLVAALLLLTVLVAPTAAPPAGAQAPENPAADRAYARAADVRDPRPLPNSVVQAGQVRVAATVAGADDVRVVVDGRDEGTLTTAGLAVRVEPGSHLVELVAAGEVLREWRFHASALATTSAGADRMDVAVAAAGHAGTPDTGRPVLLADVDQPALAIGLAPLAVATGAVALPTRIVASAGGDGSLPTAVIDRTADIAGPDGLVLVLGGLDAVSRTAVAQLRDRGLQVQRIGGGTPAEVAAAAAAHRPAQDVYRRQGDPVLRPLLVAPATPLTTAMQAAGVAARYGASLVLAGSDGIDPATADVIAGRTTVWLHHVLTESAVQAVRDAADPDATILGRPAEPAAAKHAWVADATADPALALLSTQAAGSGAAVLVDPGSAASWVARNAPASATAVGRVSAHEVAAWSVDGPSAPQVDAVLEQSSSGAVTLRLTAERPVDGADVHLTLAGREWSGTTTVQGDAVVWTAGPRPQLADALESAAPTDVDVEVTAVVAGGGHQRHVHLRDTTRIQPLSSTSPEGFAVAGGSSAVVGTGPLRTFTIEVEPATGLDLQAVAAEAEGILLDPTHGWTARGQRSMQRVGDPATANIRVVVATPGTVDRFCGRVGLNTGGRLSCWDGRRAMLNLTRWNTGVSPFHTDLEVYRRYLVSHEVGHGLGYGHVGCPGSGQLAPVMMQQSKGLGGCVANGWPHP